MKLKRNTSWIRDARNPVLAPTASAGVESECCMNPWAVRNVDGSVRLYYAGGDGEGHRRICSAMPNGDVDSWTRSGPVLEPGPDGAFDGAWCVLPHVVTAGAGDWRIYYTGNSGHGESLARFPGLGVAVSSDGATFTKHPDNPILPALHQDGAPDGQGIAGGSVLRVAMPDGRVEWRFYYTGCPTLGDDVFLDQQKTVCLAVSDDGFTWERRGAVMLRDPDHDYENIAVAGPVVRQLDDGTYRMWYSAIGTRWGYYSICYAESEDGLVWNRGEQYGDNLQLGPTFTSGGWEGQMVEYPSVIDQPGGPMRLFYCGNGYGRTGIGTAVSTPLRATRDHRGAHVVDSKTGSAWEVAVPRSVTSAEGPHGLLEAPRWQGPDAGGTIWHEAGPDRGVAVRSMIQHTDVGLAVRVTVINVSGDTRRDVRVTLDARPSTGTTRPLLLDWDRRPVDVAPGGTAVVVGTATV